MKLKYYLRGIGVGILFATIILSVSFHASSKTQISDEKIIKRAEELGMVKETDLNLDDLIDSTITPAVESTVQPNSTPTAAPTQKPTAPVAGPKEEPTAVQTTGPKEEPTQAPTAEPAQGASTDSDSQSVTELEINNGSEGNYVTVEIVPGMTSEDVSNLLKEKGIIEDTKAFNQYLKQNDYARNINIGNFEIETYASYEDIADIIVAK